jgi:hypothetical protein
MDERLRDGSSLDGIGDIVFGQPLVALGHSHDSIPYSEPW